MGAAPQRQPVTHPFGIPEFERFFRLAASIDVDKDDLKRYSEFVNDKIADLVILGHATAMANGRDIVEPFDLPITKGLQETVHRFRKLEPASELQALLEQLVTWRPQDIVWSEETERRLPEIAGGLSLALAETFTIIDPVSKNPQREHWTRATRVFDLLL